ncbi:LuxR C-terminal-related transcriptional regulator [Streptomyces albidoflavus]|uniref:helix-turn-helix transcriptional regulator n=1 Tax=Streptomyces TaxID=1883 RepID=UPI00068CEAAD|nr:MULTISPECIES: LuxR C-terminal-related transcriptional regulator [Streptomyces]MCQ9709717.1 LuxR C-terminal-related transcriptional regulator [Streptomyces sp. BSP1]QDD62559.1 helix-turn-helix transcriptional regulator [Streptomyces albidoflavus]
MESDYGEVLDVLGRQLTACAAGTGQLALVTGGLAAGKTHLAHAFAAHAAATGALCLTAAGSAAEREVPGGVADQLLCGPRVPRETSERVTRLLSTVTPETEAPVLRTLGAELLTLARQRPVVVLVDDAHLSDALSARLLAHLRRRSASAPVMLVLTRWDWEQPATDRVLTDLTRQPHTHLRLAPLTGAEVTGVLAAATTPEYAREHAPAVHRATAGNPLLVHALAEDHRALGPGLPPPPHGLPHSGPAHAQAALSCLTRWDGALLTTAQGLAVLDTAATAPLLAEVTGLPPAAVGRALGALTAAGVAEGPRLRHPALHTAVRTTLTDAEAARLHSGAAAALQHRGADPVAVARHLLAARTGDERAVGVLGAAAAQATEHGDLAFATRCLELAVRLSTDPQGRDGLRRRLARTLWQTDPAAADRRHAADRTALTRGDLPPRHATGPLKHALWQGDQDTVREALRARAGLPQERRDPRTEAELRLAHRWFYGTAVLRGTAAEPPEGRGTRVAAEDLWSRAVDAVCDSASATSGRTAVAGAEHLLESCRPGETFLEVALAALFALLRGDRPDLAAAWSDRLHDRAVRGSWTTWQAAMGAVRADLALRRGELAVATERARACLGLLAPQSWGVLRAYPLATLVSAATALGDTGAAEEAVRQLPSDTLPVSVWSLRFLCARGRHHLDADRALAAAEDFQRCGHLAREAELDVAELAPWRTGLAEVNLRLGRTVIARDLAKQQLEGTRGACGGTRGTALRVLAATADPAQRPGLLRSSAELLEAAGDRAELARSLADLSVALRSLGELDAARAVSWRAAQEAKFCRSTAGGSVPPDRAAPAPVARPGGGEPDRGEAPVLSDAEGRVALLAARGFSNRDISEQLFITVSTVEQHLTRVYRKLGVSGRRALPELLPLPRLQSA